MTQSNTETLLKALKDGASYEDKEAGLKAGVAMFVGFLNNQDRQTKAMERIAVAMAAQVDILKASMKGQSAG